jgi:hypothetical protein
MPLLANAGFPASRAWRRVSQAFAYHHAANVAVRVSPRLATLVNDAIAPSFYRLGPADRAHLVAVATWLADHGGSEGLVTAGLLHDIGKAVPGAHVSLVERAASVLLHATWPNGRHRIAALDQPPRIGTGLWVIARHARVGATILANAGYSQRVQWLVANHERTDLDDPELHALIAADSASATLPTR